MQKSLWTVQSGDKKMARYRGPHLVLRWVSQLLRQEAEAGAQSGGAPGWTQALTYFSLST